MYDYKKITSRKFDFNPEVDRQQVDPSGAIDLREAYVNGVVPGAVVVEDNRFNGVQYPECLMERPKDYFERLRQATYVKESLAAAEANAEAGHPEGA